MLCFLTPSLYWQGLLEPRCVCFHISHSYLQRLRLFKNKLYFGSQFLNNSCRVRVKDFCQHSILDPTDWFWAVTDSISITNSEEIICMDYYSEARLTCRISKNLCRESFLKLPPLTATTDLSLIRGISPFGVSTWEVPITHFKFADLEAARYMVQ
jgi:hypothetical protein